MRMRLLGVMLFVGACADVTTPSSPGRTSSADGGMLTPFADGGSATDLALPGDPDDSSLVVTVVPPSGVDETDAIQMLLDAGYLVGLQPGATYHISRTIEVRRPASGVVTVGEPATIVMTSAFDNDDPYRMFETGTTDAYAFRALNQTGVRFRNFKIEKQHVDGTYVGAFVLRGVGDSVIEGVEMSGFSLGAIITLDSVREVAVRGCAIRDSWANTVSNDQAKRKFPQLTAIVIDDNKTTSNGQVVGSRDVVIAGNTIERLRFGRDLFLQERGTFNGMTGTAVVGYQTDAITLVPGARRVSIVGNRIDQVAEGVDNMSDEVLVEGNRFTNIYDFALKIVHGGSDNIFRGNVIDGAGTAGIVVSGSSYSEYGNSYGNVVVDNNISRVGARSAYCGATAEQGFSITDTCETAPMASALLVMPNGGTRFPVYTLMHGNHVVATPDDVRMLAFIRVEAPAEHSAFFANTFVDTSGRTIGNLIDNGAVSTVIDERAASVVSADFDGNGRVDHLVHFTVSGDNRVYLAHDNRTVTLADNAIAPAAVNGSPDHVLAGDFNGDGFGDVLAHWNTGSNRFFFGSATITFSQVVDPIAPTSVNAAPARVLAGDYDGDGHDDLFFYWNEGVNRFYFGNTDGSFLEHFDPIAPTAINGAPEQIVTGDYDGDGRSDLLFFFRASGQNRFSFGESGRSFTTLIDPIPTNVFAGEYLVTGDFNLDGEGDLLSMSARYLGSASRAFVRD